MPTGDGLVSLDGFELPLEGVRVVIVVSPDDLHRPHHAGDAAGNPHFTKGATTDHADRFVVANHGWRASGAGGRLIQSAGLNAGGLLGNQFFLGLSMLMMILASFLPEAGSTVSINIFSSIMASPAFCVPRTSKRLMSFPARS